MILRNYLIITQIVALMFILNIEDTWAQIVEETFNYTGAQQSYVVPEGIYRLHIQAWGAQGADAFSEQFGTGSGGLGGFSEGDLSVIPGETLEIYVGGQGATLDNFNSGGGGFNGGGGGLSDFGFQVGGGGGGSDVRAGGSELNNRVIVAGGGGGACRGDILFGGAGGGLTGDSAGTNILGGFGGTQTQGGAGYLDNPDPPVCLDGEFGFGGSGIMPNGFCGGGGGGWYGGGSGCGAGGGSSYIDGVDNGITSSGAREGDGLIILSYDTTPLILKRIFPGFLNFINKISAEQATANGTVVFIWGFEPGKVIVSGSTCNGLTLDIKRPKILSMVTADADQIADFKFYIPDYGEFDFPILTQAVDITTCRKSQVKLNQFIRE